MIITAILLIVFGFGLSFLITSGLVYIAILLLNWLGFAFVWSWKLSFVIWVLVGFIRGIFDRGDNR